MRKLVDFLRLVRFPNLIVIALTQYAIRFGIIYPFLRQAGLHLFMPESLFLLLVISTVLIAASGYIINDYFDIKMDFVNKPNKLVVGHSIKRRAAMGWHLFLNFLALLLGAYVAYRIGHPLLVLFQLVSVALLWFYSINFKRQLLIGNVIVSALAALVPFVAGYYEIAVMFDKIAAIDHQSLQFESITSLLFSLKYLLYWILGYSAFAFLLTLIREIVKDMEDIKGDETYGCNTLPIAIGIQKTKYIALFITLITLSAIAALETIQFISKDWISLSYFLILITLPLIIIAIRLMRAETKRQFHIVSQGLKICMLFGILYTLLIYSFQ